MIGEEMHRLGQDTLRVVLTSFGAWAKSTEAIAVEVVDYSKTAWEGSATAWEKLREAKSLDKAFEVQGEYLRSSYEQFVAETTKLGGLYVDFAKEACEPLQGALTKASTTT